MVNGRTPCGAINTERRQKLFIINQLLQGKLANYTSFYFLKPDYNWTTPKWSAQQKLLLQKQPPSNCQWKQKTGTII